MRDLAKYGAACAVDPIVDRGNRRPPARLAFALALALATGGGARAATWTVDARAHLIQWDEVCHSTPVELVVPTPGEYEIRLVSSTLSSDVASGVASHRVLAHLGGLAGTTDHTYKYVHLNGVEDSIPFSTDKTDVRIRLWFVAETRATVGGLATIEVTGSAGLVDAAELVATDHVLAVQEDCSASPSESATLPPGTYEVTLDQSGLTNNTNLDFDCPYVLVRLPDSATGGDTLRYQLLNGTGDSVAFTIAEAGRVAGWFIDTDLANNAGTATLRVTGVPTGGLADRIVFASWRSGNQDIWIMDPDGSGLQQLTSHPGVDSSPMISPDGRHILYDSEASGVRQIWVMDANGDNKVQLTTSSGLSLQGVWSPDGTKIYYVDFTPRAQAIFSMDADGSNPVDLGVTGSSLGLRPDGSQLVYLPPANSNPNSYDVWTVNVDGTNARNLSSLAGLAGHERAYNKTAWGVNGRILVQEQWPTWRNSSDYEIGYVGEDGSTWGTVLAGSNEWHGMPGWSPDGSRIVFISKRGDEDFNIWTMLPDGTDLRQLTTDPARDHAPHWGRVLLSEPDTTPPLVMFVSPADGSLVSSPEISVEVLVEEDQGTVVVASDPPGIAGTLPEGGGSITGTVELVEGENVISVYATDPAGNVGGSSIVVHRDSSPPAVVLVSPPNGAVLGDTPVLVRVDAVDDHEFTVQMGGQMRTVAAGAGSAEFTIDLPEGVNPLDITLTDIAGNETVHGYSLHLDLTAPLVTLEEPLPGSCYGAGQQLVLVRVTVEDLSSVTVTSLPAGIDVTLPPGGGIVDGLVEVPEGTRTITVIATDATGRQSEASTTVTLDTTPPEVEIESPLGGSFVRGDIDVSVLVSGETASCGDVSVEILVDGESLAWLEEEPFEVELDTTLLTDGVHSIEVVARDPLGNETRREVFVEVDNTAPVIELEAPEANALVSGPSEVRATASDFGSGLASVRLLAAGEPLTTDPFRVYDPPVPSDSLEGELDTTRWPDGALLLVAEAIDDAGNEARVEVAVVVDNGVPGISILSPRDGDVVRGVLTILWEIIDEHFSHAELLVGGEIVTSAGAAVDAVDYDTEAVLDGELEIRLRAHDLAGNVTEEAITVTVDNQRVAIRPRLLFLRWCLPGCARAFVRGPNVALLDSVDPSTLELRVPGGNPVPATTECCWPVGEVGTETLRIVRFRRRDLAASLRAGVASGEIRPGRRVTLTLVAGDGARVIGQDSIRVLGR